MSPLINQSCAQPGGPCSTLEVYFYLNLQESTVYSFSDLCFWFLFCFVLWFGLFLLSSFSVCWFWSLQFGFSWFCLLFIPIDATLSIFVFHFAITIAFVGTWNSLEQHTLILCCCHTLLVFLNKHYCKAPILSSLMMTMQPC